MLIVQKFGGSSLQGADRLRQSAGIIGQTHRQGHMVCAVLSARGDTTDELIVQAEACNRYPSPREMDALLSTGEQTSVALMAMALEDMGLPVISLTGWQAGITTDDVHGNARIRDIDASRLRRELARGRIVLVTGFQGISSGQDITTLGRGGSDTSAVAIAAALEADRCQIYTDVEGIFTADPRLVPEAKKLPVVDSGEMLRLASLGSQVLHDRAAELAMQNELSLEVLSAFFPAPGTQICPLPLPEDAVRLTALTRAGDTVSLVGSHLQLRPSVSREMVTALRKEGIPVESLLQNDGRCSVTVSEGHSLAALRCLHRVFFP